MSPLVQKLGCPGRTHTRPDRALQRTLFMFQVATLTWRSKNSTLFDHLVGGGEQRVRYVEPLPSGEGWPTRAGERPAPWTLPQNLIDEARVLADGRIPLPEPERVPWDVLIAQAVNWDIPERLAA